MASFSAKAERWRASLGELIPFFTRNTLRIFNWCKMQHRPRCANKCDQTQGANETELPRQLHQWCLFIVYTRRRTAQTLMWVHQRATPERMWCPQYLRARLASTS
ncbi:unnamed protein product [Ixodes persulcatus]